VQQVWALRGDEMPASVRWVDAVLPRVRPWLSFRLERFFLILWLLFSLVLMGVVTVPSLLVEEKVQRTYDVLMLASVRPIDVVAGKAITGWIAALLSAALVIAVSGSPVGNRPATLLSLMAGAVLTTALGLLVGVRSRTSPQVSVASSLLMILLLAPGWLVMGITSPALRAGLQCLPTFYLVRALRLSLSGQASLGQVGGDLAAVAGFTVAALAGVLWTLHRAELRE
jgi:ABC-2 type transport system permease protein